MQENYRRIPGSHIIISICEQCLYPRDFISAYIYIYIHTVAWLVVLVTFHFSSVRTCTQNLHVW